MATMCLFIMAAISFQKINIGIMSCHADENGKQNSIKGEEEENDAVSMA